MTSTRTQPPGARGLGVRIVSGTIAVPTAGTRPGPVADRQPGMLWSLLGVSLVALGVASPAPVSAGAPLGATIARADQDWARPALVHAQAQADQKPRINIGKVVLVEPASETAMPIQVGPIDAIPRNSFVRIRGLPSAAVLSDGHSIAPGAWAIPLAVLPNLRISLPVGIMGKSDVTIALVQIDGTVLAEAKSSLIIVAAAMIAPEQQPPQRERSVASVGPPSAPLEASPSPSPRPPVPPAASSRSSEPPQPTEDQQRALAFLERGRSQAERGNISAARLFYRRAADAGLGQGALALAGTYDPDELARMRVAGVQPDLALAREWYEKARQLGASEAEARLRRLGSR
jgi:hypothetical protein